MLPEGNEVHPMILHCKRVLEENPHISLVQLTRQLHLESVATAAFWRIATENYLHSLLPDEEEEWYQFDGDEALVVKNEQEDEDVNTEQEIKPWWKFWERNS